MGDENTMRGIGGFPRPPPKVFGGLQDLHTDLQPQQHQGGRRPLGDINNHRPPLHPTNNLSFKNNLSSTHNKAPFSIYEDTENQDPSGSVQLPPPRRNRLNNACPPVTTSAGGGADATHRRGQHHHHQPPPLRTGHNAVPLLHPVAPPPSALPPAPFAIHQDDDAFDGGGGGEALPNFPPPPPLPSASDIGLQMLRHPSVTEFRSSQNTSMSSVSSEDERGADEMWRDTYNDEFTTEEEEMTSSVRKSPEEASSETGQTEEELSILASNDDSAVTVSDRPQAVSDHVLGVADYQDDILELAKARELEYLPKPNYMEKQTDISFPMRSILVDWLVEVGEEFDVETETVHLAVNYVDRFLSFMSVQRAKLQLVGTSSMFIASKYEEIYPKELDKFVYITDDTYNKRQVLKMEKLILGVLKFSVSPPTAHFFVTHLAKMAGCEPKAVALAQYLAELSLLDGETYLGYLPSVVGSAAVALARHTLGYAAWDENMARRSGYEVTDISGCLISLHRTFGSAKKCPQQSIVEKYKHARFFGVANVEPTPIFE